MKPFAHVRQFNIRCFIQKWSSHFTWIHPLYGPKVTNQRNFTLLIKKITKETTTDYQNNMAIQCISFILMKYYSNVMSHFIQFLFLSKNNFHAVNHRFTLDSSRQHKQENSTQESNSRITETRLLFRYATCNYLHSGGTPKGTLPHPRTDWNS